jgi:hypothetical protein
MKPWADFMAGVASAQVVHGRHKLYSPLADAIAKSVMLNSGICCVTHREAVTVC